VAAPAELSYRCTAWLLQQIHHHQDTHRYSKTLHEHHIIWYKKMTLTKGAYL
jgi:hypothetical protein